MLSTSGRLQKEKHQKYRKFEPNTTGEFFKGIGFSVGPHRPELYLKTKESLGLYTSTQAHSSKMDWM